MASANKSHLFRKKDCPPTEECAHQTSTTFGVLHYLHKFIWTKESWITSRPNSAHFQHPTICLVTCECRRTESCQPWQQIENCHLDQRIFAGSALENPLADLEGKRLGFKGWQLAAMYKCLFPVCFQSFCRHLASESIKEKDNQDCFQRKQITCPEAENDKDIIYANTEF